MGLFKAKPIVQGLALAFGGLTVAGIVAAPAHSQERLERIEVTGTRIMRADVETTQPVVILSREDIERSGKTTVQELLQNLPVVSGGSFSEGTNAGNSFAPGTASVSLRGLGVNTVLVLLNGRRLASYGFAQNLNEAFVDLNSIPVTAIERIDILKDGASAVYGSDAIAGVINIILRRDFIGLEVSGGYGFTSQGGGEETRASLAAGFGDIAKNRFNLMGTLDYFKREKIGAGDREYSKTADQSPRQGFDQRSPTGQPGAWFVGGSLQPFANCPPSLVATHPILAGNTCLYDYATDNWLIPKTERIGLFARGVFEFSPTLQAFAEAGYTNNVTNQSAAATPGGFAVPAANPSNPFGQSAFVLYRTLEAGQRLNEIDSENTRAVLGLKGTAGKFDWEVAANHSKNEATNTGTNYIDNRHIVRAIAGVGVCAVDPSTGAMSLVSTPASLASPSTGIACQNHVIPAGVFYNVANGFANPQALIDAIKFSPVRKGEAQMTSYDAKLSTELMQMAHGPLAMAAGVEYREEEIKDTPDVRSRLGVIVGSGGTSSQGSRDVTVGYVEFSVPFAKGFESQLAVRQDKYSDFGSATTWKAGLGFRPSAGTLLRTTVSTGFRAPALVELFLGESFSFPTVRDVPRCNIYTAAYGATNPLTLAACGNPQIRTRQAGNPNLQAEESQSVTVGFVFEPTNNLTVGFDYFNIDHENIIVQPTVSFLVNNAAQFPPGTVNRNAPSAADLTACGLAGVPTADCLGGLRGTSADPTGFGFNRSFFNATRQRTWGWDIDLQYRWTVAALGRFTAKSVSTYLGSFRAQVNPGGNLNEYVDTWEYPRWRNTTSLLWTRGPWDTTVAVNYIDSFENFYQTFKQRVEAFTTYDAQVRYTGFKNTELVVGGNNIFDEDPPSADLQWSGYADNVHNPRGAFFYVRAKYKF